MSDTDWTFTEKSMVMLSFLAYNGFWDKDPEAVAKDVADIVGWLMPHQEMVWGPALHQPDFTGGEARVTDALVFMTRDTRTGQYQVVTRGTNPFSATAWITQDFLVDRLLPWTSVSPLAAAGSGQVSRGTANAVGIHSRLLPRDGCPGAGRTLLDAMADILAAADAGVVFNFTGHSLGGLLAPTMALWCHDQLGAPALAKLRDKAAFAVYAFAGPTAGDSAFLSYSCGRIPGIRAYQNSRDLAVRAWNEASMDELPTIYDPITMDPILQAAYGLCMDAIRGKDYQQFPCCKDVQSTVDTGLRFYIVEAAYQHTVPYLAILDPSEREQVSKRILEPLRAMGG